MIDLAIQAPFDGPGLLEFLAIRAIPGVEEVVGHRYRRVLDMPAGPIIAEVLLDTDTAAVSLDGGRPRDRAAAVTAIRALIDADADPGAVLGVLAADDALAPLVRAAPGRRAPGAVDASELAVRAVLGQQISVAAARTLGARLAFALGREVTDTGGGLSRAFPRAAAIATIDHAALGMPASRARTLTGLCARLACGRLVLDPAGDVAGTRDELLACPGVGPWTANYIAMRALRDRDAFPATDLGVRRAARRLGLPDTASALSERAEAWRPYRSYAVHHLWAALS